jgi:hypothetical protein
MTQQSPTLIGVDPNPRIVSVVFPRCGTCVFAQAFKSNMADCHGRPPTPMVVGASQDALGRPILTVENLVPRVTQDRPACSLYKRKEDFATRGNS